MTDLTEAARATRMHVMGGGAHILELSATQKSVLAIEAAEGYVCY